MQGLPNFDAINEVIARLIERRDELEAEVARLEAHVARWQQCASSAETDVSRKDAEVVRLTALGDALAAAVEAMYGGVAWEVARHMPPMWTLVDAARAWRAR